MKTTITLDREQKLLTIVIPGDLTSLNARELRVEIDGVLAETPVAWQLLRLDLTAAKMVDSTGLNLIVAMYKAAQGAGAKMQLTYHNPNVRRALTFTRLDKFVELVEI
jgi:anti-anti-sigma factor